MKVQSYTAHNVMRVSDIRFDMEGRHLFLVGGKNGQGKTSAITALLMALCGKSGMEWPEFPLQEGQDEGWVKVELSGDEELHDLKGFTVEVKLKRRRNGAIAEEFRVLDSTGEAASEPRTLLKSLYELRAFDPLAFERMNGKEKKALLQKLLGIDLEPQKQEYKRLYEERTRVNRDAAKLKAQYESLPFHKDAPEEEVSVKALMEELEAAQAHNASNKKQRDHFERVLAQKSNADEEIDKITKQIEELLHRRKALMEARDLCAREIESLRDTLKTLSDRDVAPIRQQIKDADAINAKVRENAKRQEVKKRLDEHLKAASDLTAQLEANTKAQEEALRSAPWPVEGLELTEEGVLYNGLPFEQASKAQRVLASVKIGMSLNPKLRLLVCEDGSALDTETLEALEKELVAHDFQMLVELVTRTREDEDLCAVVIRDGEVANS